MSETIDWGSRLRNILLALAAMCTVFTYWYYFTQPFSYSILVICGTGLVYALVSLHLQVKHTVEKRMQKKLTQYFR
jgi:hypothetical protein